jgi:hypothetical protein
LKPGTKIDLIRSESAGNTGSEYPLENLLAPSISEFAGENGSAWRDERDKLESLKTMRASEKMKPSEK